MQGVFAGFVMLSGVNVVFFAKLTPVASFAVLASIFGFYIPYFLIEIHCHYVLKSAFLPFDEKGEIPKMFDGKPLRPPPPKETKKKEDKVKPKTPKVDTKQKDAKPKASKQKLGREEYDVSPRPS